MVWSKEKFATAAGTCILDPENTVKIGINDSEYIYKKARDVNAGDMVEFKKDFLDKSLGELEEVILEIEPVYRYAKEQLHELNNRREYIPKLRTLLIRGINNEDLEDKILKEGDDFSTNEYEEMEARVETAIINGQMIPLSSGHKGWLKGNTVAPALENWHYFRALESINPEFREWDSNDESLTGMYMSYRFYNAARRGVKAHLARCKGQGVGHQEGEDGGDRNGRRVIDLRRMLKGLAEHFFKDVDRQYLYVRVLDRSHLFKKNQGGGEEQIDTNLTKGIVVYGNGGDGSNANNPSNDSGGGNRRRLKSYNSLYSDIQILSDYLNTLLTEKYSNEVAKKYDVSFADQAYIFHHIEPYLFEWFGELNVYMKEQKEESEQDHLFHTSPNIGKMDSRKIFSEFLNSFKKDILDGKIDSAWDLETGTTYKILETLYKIKNVIPQKIYDYQLLCIRNKSESVQKYVQKRMLKSVQGMPKLGEVDANYVHSIYSEIEKLYEQGIFPDYSIKENYHHIHRIREELKKEYGVDFDIYGINHTKKKFLTTKLSGDFTRQKGWGIKSKYDKSLIQISLNEDRRSTSLYSKKEVNDVLDKYNLSEIINVRKEDFYWEEKPSIIGSYANKIGSLFKKK